MAVFWNCESLTLHFSTMFYRRKVILALLEALGEVPLTTEDFQRHLFLFTRRQVEPSYDFVPLRQGCYSFSAVADRPHMVQMGLLREGNAWQKATEETFALALSADDRRILDEHLGQVGHLQGMELARAAHKDHPWYAMRSEFALDILGPAKLAETLSHFRPNPTPALMTIGYEGLSTEAYLNTLMRNGVDLLIDVRGNPQSRKFGFSKFHLSSMLEECGITYEHIPELGIESSRRTGIEGAEAYRALFEAYCRDTLPNQQEALDRITDRVSKDGLRVALTCFERDHTSCHRDSVVQAIQSRNEWSHPVRHL